MKLEDIKPAINHSVLTLYRVFAIVSLYAVLAAVLMFGLGSAFYAGSKTWVAPVILSQSDKDTLDLTSKTLATQNTVDNLTLDMGKLANTVAEAQSHKAKLAHLLPSIDEAIEQENRHKRATGPVLATVKVGTDPEPTSLPPRDGPYLRSRFREALLGAKAHASQ